MRAAVWMYPPPRELRLPLSFMWAGSCFSCLAAVVVISCCYFILILCVTWWQLRVLFAVGTSVCICCICFIFALLEDSDKSPFFLLFPYESRLELTSDAFKLPVIQGSLCTATQTRLHRKNCFSVSVFVHMAGSFGAVRGPSLEYVCFDFTRYKRQTRWHFYCIHC